MADRRDDSRVPRSRDGTDPTIAGRPTAFFRMLDEDERFQDLLEQMGAVVTEFDEDGRVVRVSSSVRSTLGYEPGELIGRDDSHLAPPDDYAGRADKDVIRDNLRQRLRHKSGHWVWLATSATRSRQQGGSAARLSVRGVKQRVGIPRRCRLRR